MISSPLMRAAAVAATSAALLVAGTSMAGADSGSGSLAPSASDRSARPHAITSSAPPARGAARRAAVPPIDITSVRTSNLAVNAKGERVFTRFGYKLRSGASFDSISIRANMYHGGRFVRSISFGGRDGAYWTFASRYGRGSYRVGGFVVHWTSGGVGHTGVDHAAGSFSAKSALKGGFKHAKVIKIKRTGSRHVLKVNLKRFVKSGSWKGYSKKVSFQQKKGGWHTIKRLKLKKGKKTYTFFTSSTRKYRIKVAGTSTTVGGKSLVIRI